MLIDCDACEVRGPACEDCVVSVLLAGPPLPVELDADHRTALAVLADSGLVPPLRLVEGPGRPPDGAEPGPRRATG